ncbi:protein ROOT PRIMORDIUM DEFECTIVE 1 [Amborella trichopoda]|nr:protein ROOT PRIMORDIUM DEFECTIVE 1 [Amborella trichopoda]|eukprot:XP_011627112.1 protein ROOT PRIMORDIUM DEFECTIVE 1 [Amborella trichopoda]
MIAHRVVRNPKFSWLLPGTIPSLLIFCNFSSTWSMKKDPALESALSRNRRWIVNNQLKNIILRCPNQATPVRFLQKKFKTLDLKGKAPNWIKKYPRCFETFMQENEPWCRLTKRMMALVEEEEIVKSGQEPVLVERLAKFLMLSKDRRINAMKFNEFKRNFGFPDDYFISIIPKYPELFRVINFSGKRNGLEIELLSWDPNLALSFLERKVQEEGKESPSFQCLLPLTWKKSWEKFIEFNESPYISPYAELPNENFKEKRDVGLIHEILSLTLWKKASIVKLGHFKREFILPDRLDIMLMKHPGIFYVSNRYQIHTVVLREGYSGSELIDKDPLVIVKDKFGELMQEGLHEYNRRRCALNLEKKKQNLIPR